MSERSSRWAFALAVALMMTMSGAQAADDAKDPNMDPNKYPSWKENYFVSADGHLMPAKKDQPPPDLRYFNQVQK